MRQPSWFSGWRLAALALLCAGTAPAQQLRLAGAIDDSSVSRLIPALAEQALAVYRDANRARWLDNRYRLQIAARRYEDAVTTIRDLREVKAKSASTPLAARAADIPYEIWSLAMARSARTGSAFAPAFAEAFRDVIASLDDRTAALVIRAMSAGAAPLVGALRTEVARLRGPTAIGLNEAVSLARTYQRAEAQRSFAPLLPPLIAEDDQRRYIAEHNVSIRVPDGAIVCAVILRPRTTRKLPALLQFTIYVDSAASVADVRRAASNGYVGVVGYTRGKACSSDAIVPYRYDGKDAAALIDWIARQPWSDGRVGMYGGSYSGFTAWAAANQTPKALKAIMVGAPAAPGIDAPMEGNIVWNFQYPWPFYAASNKTLDVVTYGDNARWRRINREWYVSGGAYRDLAKIDGTPNPVWDDWLAHPSYDAYWQAGVPVGAEFARIDIPILQTAGYFFGGPGAAVYYLNEHYSHNPRAKHYLVIGPYDHPQGQRGVVSALGDTTTNIAGYETDRVAHIDLVAELRYQWFDWILRGGARPSLLKDRINYEVTGANQWKHAPSIPAMSNGRLRFYLMPGGSKDADLLALTPATADTAVTLRVDLAYRADIDSNFAGGAVRDVAVNAYAALKFVSDPIDRPTEVSGLYSGHLEFVTNKRDFDLGIGLFELTLSGEYYMLPPFQMRASYAKDLTTRRLLTPGVRQAIDFTAIRLTSRQMQRGSRLVAVIGPIKGPGQQINYGSGKNVNDETIADAGDPLEIRWLATSYIDIPIRR